MSQQEMNFEDINREQEFEYHQHSSEHARQKVYPQTINKKTGLQIRTWIAYISLALAIVMSFVLGGQNWDIGVGNIAPHWVVLLTVYLIIIGVNVAINVFIAKNTDNK